MSRVHFAWAYASKVAGMVSPSRAALVSSMVLITAAAGGACSGSGGSARGSEAGRAGGGGRVAPAGSGYTSDQLRQALLTEIVGYQRAGEPDAGEYGSLKAIQNFNQLQRQITLDKPRCTNVTSTGGAGLRAAPAALAVFAKPGSGESATVTLMAVPVITAERQVRVRVPDNCRSFRARVGDQWSSHRVVEGGPGGIGLGSRTVGVTTTTGDAAVKTWYVVLRGRGYLGTLTLYGPNVTRTEAEQLARQMYDQAERILA